MIELKNVSRTYQMGKIEVRALRHASLKITPGEFVAIIGPSGSGKSTLLHILGLLDRPDSGTYLLAGRDVTATSDEEQAVLRNHLVGFIFQQFHLLPRITALENAELPLIYAGKRHLKEKAHEKILEVGLGAREGHRPNELSGGEQQRVAIARALVNDPRIIIADEPTGNLDSKSEQEIIDILTRLNKQGKTVILVTHEREIADHAERVISMRDGEIISDERKEKKDAKVLLHKTSSPEEAPEDILPQTHLVTGRAEFIDHFRQAIYAITSNKMRSALSMLGILIGVGAVIAMMAIGQGAKEAVAEQLASLGSNRLNIYPGQRRVRGVSTGDGGSIRYTLEDVKAVAKLPEIRYVSPALSQRMQAVYGNKNWNTRIEGTGVAYPHLRNAAPTVGRFFSEEEVRMRARVAVLGVTVVKELFGENTNPVGSRIKINRVNFQVIGVLPEKGGSGWGNQDDIIEVPVTTAMYRLFGAKNIWQMEVEVKDMSLIEQAKESIKTLLKERHHIEPDDEDAIRIWDMAETQEVARKTIGTITGLLGSIAAISLLVGGIGIMNIMLVSVTERTREIGLRKALGARRKDIMVQFLIEAVVLTVIGGILGILFGSGVAWILAILAKWSVRISLFSIVLATTFSIIIGVSFGIWPARQAARLNPIEALRYE